MNINQLPALYDSCKMTLKETSKDDSKEKKNIINYVSESRLEAYNFDDVKKIYHLQYIKPISA